MKLKAFCLVFLLLLSTYVWFDYSSKKNLCIKVPVRFSTSSSHPVIDVYIQNHAYPSCLDLGLSAPLILEEKVFDKIKRRPYKISGRTDFRGNSYFDPSYFIPKIVIGSLSWQNVLGVELHPDWENNTRFLTNELLSFIPEVTPITVGAPLLKKTNMLLDFSNKALYLCNNLKTLQKKGVIKDKLIKIPFTLKGPLIVLEATTDWGKKKLLFDTGSSFSLIHTPLIPPPTQDTNADQLLFLVSNQFILGGYDFGKQTLHTMASHFEIGFLGMDFIKHHTIYIDYKNKTLYIDKKNEI